MFVISITGTKKKLRLLIKVLVAVVLIAGIALLFNLAFAASTDEGSIIQTQAPLAGAEEGADQGYPGEPIRVYNSLEQYWLDKLEIMSI